MSLRVLITGGLGLVGGRLAEGLGRENEVVISTRRNITESIRVAYPSSIRFVNHGDLLNSSVFPEKMDVVIHTTAMNERDCANDPQEAVRVNVEGTRQVLERAIENGVKRIIYLSTVHVYGKQTMEANEQSIPRPDGVYAITHKTAEDYIIAAHDEGKIEGIVVRMSNSFGRPVLKSANCWGLLVNDISRQAATTQRIILNSDGRQHRDFITLTYAQKGIEFLMSLKSSPSQSVFNLTSSRSFSVLEMAEMVASTSADVLGIKVGISRKAEDATVGTRKISIQSDAIRQAGFNSENDYSKEISNLLMYCKAHFGNE